jgi:hypothetical protein
VEKCGRAGDATDDSIIWCMHFACWITKTTNTLRICNTAFPQQQWLHECASVLCSMYIACVVDACQIIHNCPRIFEMG